MHRRKINACISMLLFCALICAPLVRAHARTAPVAASFSTTVPTNRQSLILLQGSDAEGTALTYATTSTPAHGTLAALNAATGYVVYTPAANYTGSDAFTYTVASGGDTSSAGTVTITVTSAKTTITDTLIDPAGNPRSGKVTFILTTQNCPNNNCSVIGPAGGIIPVGATVSAPLNNAGQFTVQLYPSRSMSPVAYYQLWFNDSTTGRQESLGVYDLPASNSVLTLAPYKITNANLATPYTFAPQAAVETLAQSAAAAAQAALGNSPTFSGTVTAGHFSGDGSSLTNLPVPPLPNSPTFSGTVTAPAFVGNGSALTGIGVGTSTGSSAPASLTLNFDNDNSGGGSNDAGGILDIIHGSTTAVRVHNNGILEALQGLKISGGYSYFNSPSGTGQAFTQIDQPTGTPFNFHVGHLFESVAETGSIYQANIVGRMYAGTKVGGSITGGMFEARSTPGSSSDTEIIGVPGIADCDTGSAGPCRAIEGDLNVGNGDAPTTYRDHTTRSFSAILFGSTGGKHHPDAGLYITSTRSDAKVRYGIHVNANAYDTVGIYTGRPLPTGTATAGELVIGHIPTRDAVRVMADSTTTGNAFNVLSSGGTSVASISPSGDILSTTKLYNIGGQGFQLWKDAAPSKAWNIGMEKPGGAIGDTLKFSFFNGSAWVDGAELTSTYFSLGGVAAVSYGSGAPSGACSAGIYIRTGMGAGVPGLYVCENSAWVAK